MRSFSIEGAAVSVEIVEALPVNELFVEVDIILVAEGLVELVFVRRIGAFHFVGQPHGTQRYVPTLKPDEDELTWNVVLNALSYSRYYESFSGKLRDECLKGEILYRL